MSKSIKEVDELIDNLEEEDEDIEEASTTAADPGYMTPHAYTGKKKSLEKRRKKNAEKAGYKLVKEMSIFKKMMINEATYKDYKNDQSMTSRKKVNVAIKEVNRKLFEIERIIDQNTKLKTEDGIDSNKYWKSTKVKMHMIGERMVRISNKLKDFGQ